MADNTKGMMSFVPGMDFMQNLFKAAPGIAQSLPPSLTQWIAPTMSVEEIDKKIADLKSVQSWLETNTAMLKATVQALEVQRMTISTLKSMKINLADVPGYAMGAAKEAVGEIAEKPLDPMQWWGALSKQMTQPFAQLDAKAMQDTAKNAAKAMAKGAASAAASTMAAASAGAAMDAAFGMADKSFKVASGMAKTAMSKSPLRATAAKHTPKKISSVANKTVRKASGTSTSISKRKVACK
jgi:predicted XRE-type DNA-binding protein